MRGHCALWVVGGWSIFALLTLRAKLKFVQAPPVSTSKRAFKSLPREAKQAFWVRRMDNADSDSPKLFNFDVSLRPNLTQPDR